MLDAVDPNENLINMPAPELVRPPMNPPLADLCGEYWSEAVPPEPNGLMADIDAPFEQQILHLAQRQRITNVHHDREADHFRRTVEAAERISHPSTLSGGVSPLNPDCPDNALSQDKSARMSGTWRADR